MTAADQLKACLRIEDVIGAHVKLKRQGKGPRYFGPCPFHEDKSPSFTVHAELGFWKCFGCGEGGGDFLSFVQRVEKPSFPETSQRGIGFNSKHRSDQSPARLSG